ncbi:MAG: aminopeptidase [Bacteroidetes bacterium]|nr:aminopeptidase [Bacteroidota bacterium]
MKYLNDYAELVIKTGINLKPGQNICIKTGPDTYSFAQTLSETAYKLGAGYVFIEIHDQKLIKTRVDNQNKKQLAELPDFIIQQHAEYVEKDWAYIRIDNTEDRDQLSETDSGKLTIHQTSIREKLTDFYSSLMRHEHAWCVICAPGKNWAKSVLGDTATENDLWEILIPILKLGSGNAASRWEEFGKILKKRCSYLNGLGISELHLTDSGTDLTIKMVPSAVWIGGSDTLSDGREFFPNIPTEEIFSVPDLRGVNGFVSTTRPVTVLGKQVIDAKIHLKDGVVYKYSAKQGEDILDNFFSIDDGAKRLGEIALVDETSPISVSDVIFNSTLFDENASCHIAFGAGYPSCLSNHSDLLSDDDLLANGCNTSVTHVDFMIGSPKISITAKLRDGGSAELMKQGKFSF